MHRVDATKATIHARLKKRRASQKLLGHAGRVERELIAEELIVCALLSRCESV